LRKKISGINYLNTVVMQRVPEIKKIAKRPFDNFVKDFKHEEPGLRAFPLVVSRGNSNTIFKKLYHKCAQNMVLYVKHRMFELDRIGGPELRCINKGPSGYDRWQWYEETKATCKIENSSHLNSFMKEEWYKKKSSKYDGSVSSHASGRGIDYFTRKEGKGKNVSPTLEEKKVGDNFVKWVIQEDNRDLYNVKNVIWNKKVYSSNNNWVEGKYRKEKTRPHYDHVHVEHNKLCQ